MRLHKHILSWIALAELLSATVYAPLFHIHADGHGAPLLHTHFPEIESIEDESVVHMEAPHSHVAAKSVDVLITTASPPFFFFPVAPSSPVELTPPQPSRGFVPAASARAHAPPALEFLTPRAPPA